MTRNRMDLPVRLSTLRGVAIATLLALSAHATAQDDAKPKPIRLEPKEMAGVDRGRAVVVKGEIGRDPQRFLLEGISYMHPVAVALRPVNKGDQLSMSITKYAWDRPLRQGETDGEILRYVFRTEGEFQVTVSGGADATPYRLLVWVGDEVRPEMAPVVVKASEYDGASSDGGSWLPWVIAGAAVAAVALLAVLVLRRRKA